MGHENELSDLVDFGEADKNQASTLRMRDICS
jgi:hypothetical protein